MTAKIRLLIRELRQDQELSQDELARALGISRQSIISLERGEYMPSFPLLMELISFFNCPLDQLIEGAPVIQVVNKSEENEEGGESVMQLSRFDPFQAIDQMHDEMNSVVKKTFGRVDWPNAIGSNAGAMNIHETDKEYVLEIQVPGYREDEVNLELTDNTLTVSGEKKAEDKEENRNYLRREWEHATFSRSVRFSQPIAEDKVEAKLSDGTLKVTAPKVEPIRPKVKKIEVKK